MYQPLRLNSLEWLDVIGVKHVLCLIHTKKRSPSAGVIPRNIEEFHILFEYFEENLISCFRLFLECLGLLLRYASQQGHFLPPVHSRNTSHVGQYLESGVSYCRFDFLYLLQNPSHDTKKPMALPL